MQSMLEQPFMLANVSHLDNPKFFNTLSPQDEIFSCLYLITKNGTDLRRVSPTSQQNSMESYLCTAGICSYSFHYSCALSYISGSTRYARRNEQKVPCRWIQYGTLPSARSREGSSRSRNWLENNISGLRTNNLKNPTASAHSRLRKADRNPLYMVGIMAASVPRQDLPSGWNDDPQRYEQDIETATISVQNKSRCPSLVLHLSFCP